MKFGKAAVILIGLSACFLSGCETEVTRVKYNIEQEADNFNVVRRLAVINTIDGTPIFEMVGNMSVEYSENGRKLTAYVEVEKGHYKKHIIGLNDASTMFVIEDLSGADVSRFQYEINYLPQEIIPYSIVYKE